MVVANRRMRPAQTLQVVRRAARRQGWVVVEVPGRARGSHQLFAVADEHGERLARFVVPQHPRELSWLVLRSIESDLAPLFGQKWMEER